MSASDKRVQLARRFNIRASIMPSAALPLAIYAVSRLFGAVVLAIGANRQAEVAMHPSHYVLQTIPASPGYWGVMANWDGQWYKTIALLGYPTELPTVDGHVVHNPWAFYPLFPTLTGALMRLTGLSFEVAGGLLSLFCGGVAIVVLYRMLRRRMSVFASGATIAALCSYPTAPVLQVAYSESVTLLVLVLTFWALQERRYAVFSGLAIVLALARPIPPPLMLVTIAHWISRWRLDGVPRRPREWAKPVATVAVIGGSTFLWPAIAWLVTGERRAFFLTQGSWRQSTRDSFFARTVFGQAFESPSRFLFWLLIPLAFFAVLAIRPAARRWGVELRTWVAVYPAYILLATQPTLSVLRYLMLALVPWWPLPEAGERHDETGGRKILSWALLVFIVSLGFLLQYYWVTGIFTIDVSPGDQGFP